MMEVSIILAACSNNQILKNEKKGVQKKKRNEEQNQSSNQNEKQTCCRQFMFLWARVRFCSFIAWSFICCTSQICDLFGVWCSDNPRKCMQYATGATYNVDSTGTQPMILVCRVLLGDSKVTAAVLGLHGSLPPMHEKGRNRQNRELKLENFIFQGFVVRFV